MRSIKNLVYRIMSLFIFDRKARKKFKKKYVHRIISQKQAVQLLIKKTSELDRKITSIGKGVNHIFQYHTGLVLTDENYNPEREIVFEIDSAPIDHLQRYIYARDLVSHGDTILDCACGVGYGSAILAERAKQVVAVDISKSSIDWANRYFRRDNIEFLRANALEIKPTMVIDKIISFETIEHLRQDVDLVGNFYSLLKPGGVLICSVPNEEIFPWISIKNSYHFRHYTPNEFVGLLKNAGFSIEKQLYQSTMDFRVTEDSKNGFVIVCVARKSI